MALLLDRVEAMPVARESRPDRALSPGRDRSDSRARALVIEGSQTGPLQDSSARLDGRIELVARLTPSEGREALRAALSSYRPQLVLVEAPLAELDFELLRQCSEQKIRLLTLFQPSYGLAAGGPIVRLGGLPWLPLHPLRLARRHLLAKRAFDLALVLLFAPFLLLLTAAIAVAIAATSSGGVLYRQTRVGKGGKPFELLKFRTMRAHAERETGPVLARPDDPRVTPIGRVLRRLHLDELPQLWNVVRGEMSLVGPRPERPELEAAFRDLPDYDHRHLVQPGLTGLAQLVGGYSATAADKLRCDLLYLSRRSLWLDLRLIGRTLLDLLRGFPVA